MMLTVCCTRTPTGFSASNLPVPEKPTRLGIPMTGGRSRSKSASPVSEYKHIASTAARREMETRRESLFPPLITSTQTWQLPCSTYPAWKCCRSQPNRSEDTVWIADFAYPVWKYCRTQSNRSEDNVRLTDLAAPAQCNCR